MLINENNFLKEVIEYPNYVILVFFASWCMPCKKYHELLDNSFKINSKAKVCYVNIENESNLLSYFKIQSIPKTIIFKNGKKVIELLGLIDESTLLSYLL